MESSAVLFNKWSKFQISKMYTNAFFFFFLFSFLRGKAISSYEISPVVSTQQCSIWHLCSYIHTEQVKAKALGRWLHASKTSELKQLWLKIHFDLRSFFEEAQHSSPSCGCEAFYFSSLRPVRLEHSRKQPWNRTSVMPLLVSPCCPYSSAHRPYLMLELQVCFPAKKAGYSVLIFFFPFI